MRRSPSPIATRWPSSSRQSPCWPTGTVCGARDIDPEALLNYWIDRVERLLRACVRDRETVSAERSLDIGFHELNGNEMAILRNLYRTNGTSLPPETEAALQGYLDDNPRGKHGRLRYDLQRDFGRSPDDIRERFGFYYSRFNVREES